MVQRGNLHQPGTNSKSSFTLHSLFFPLRMSVKMTSLLCQQLLVEGFLLTRLLSTLSITHAVDKLVVLQEIITVPVMDIHLHGSERQVTPTEKQH